MDVSILAWGFSLFSGFHGFQSLHHDQAFKNKEPENQPKHYQCEKFVWTQPIHWDSKGYYLAELSFTCTIKAQHGGGFSNLRAYFRKKIKEEAIKIFKEEEIKYQGLKGVKVDAKIKMGTGLEVIARQDHFLATDDKTTLVFDTYSKEVEGTGNAAYLDGMDSGSTVESTPIKGEYLVKALGRFRLSKPWYAPGFIFKGIVEDELSAQVPLAQKNLMTELSSNI